VPILVFVLCSHPQLNHIFGGSCEINPANYAEFYCSSIMLIFGSSVWAYVIGSCCGIIATIDPALLEHRTMMDELNFFARDQVMPDQLTIRLRGYFRQTLDQLRAERYERLLGRMSTRLRGDTSYRMASRHVRQVPYLSMPNIEAEFLSHIAVRMRVVVYSRLERVSCTRLFVISKGVACKRGVLGLAGYALGKDFIVSNQNLRDLADAIALTFLQGTALSQADIYEFLPNFPVAYTAVRKAAFRIALTRALVKAAELKRTGMGRGEHLRLDEALQTATSTPVVSVHDEFDPLEEDEGSGRWSTKMMASFKIKKRTANGGSNTVACARKADDDSPKRKRPGLVRSATTRIFASEVDVSARRDFSKAFSVPKPDNAYKHVPEVPTLDDRIKSLESNVADIARVVLLGSAPSSNTCKSAGLVASKPASNLEAKVDDMHKHFQTLMAKVGDLAEQVKPPLASSHGRLLQKQKRVRQRKGAPVLNCSQEGQKATNATGGVRGEAPAITTSEDKLEMLEEGAVAETRSSPFDA
jgi:hypothetical protein